MATDLVQTIGTWIEPAWARAVVIGAATLIAALLIEKVITGVLEAAVSRTATQLDDEVLAALRRPIFLSVILFGLSLVVQELDVGAEHYTLSILKTVAVLVWAGAAFRVSHEVLQFLSARSEGQGLLQSRTLPVFDIVLKTAVIGAAVYFFFLAWKIDVTAWLASAGIVGIAVGFAAKDTLANLFAGLFIAADAPYQVGDYILLDGDLDGRPLRGAVTRIGMRSSRILTRDDLEITIPNALIANSKIINESGGPTKKQRSRVSVGVAYGSDVERVAQVLLESAQGIDGVCQSPTPEVRFRSFGDSSLDFEVLFWIDRPMARGLVQSRVNFRIYEGLARANITIPFPQRDVWIREAPQKESRSA